MRSYTGALCELVNSISLHTSARGKNRGSDNSCPGTSRYSSVSKSKVGWII